MQDCSFERNYRQGLSVISAENLTVVNSSFSDTGVPYGTAPSTSRPIKPPLASLAKNDAMPM